MKNHIIIPTHELQSDQFLFIERIEDGDGSGFHGAHRHHFYEILWFTNIKNGLKHQIDFVDYELESNQIYILSPNQVHTMDLSTQKGFVIAFTKDFFKSILDIPAELFLRPYFFHTKINKDLNLILNKLMELMLVEYHSLYRKSILEAYCTAFVLNISSLKEKNTNNYSERIVKVLRLIDESFWVEKEVAFYANAVNLSERRLNELCVQSTGQTVKQLIIDRIMTEAKRLINTENLSIKEIAYQLGFNDPAYFSRLFRKKTNISPEQYRNRSSNS